MEGLKESATPAVARGIGKLPDLWNRRAVFFANLLSLFYGNDSETADLKAKVGSIETYGGRLIPIIDLLYRKGGSLLLLQRRPDSRLLDYFTGTLGLTLPEIEVLSHDAYLSVLQKERSMTEEMRCMMGRLKEFPAEWLDGFVTDPALAEIAAATGKQLMTGLRGSRRGNNKYLIYEYIERCGLPVFDTRTAASSEELRKAVAELRAMGYRKVVVKAQIGASGIGIHKLLPDDPAEAPDFLFHEGPCLVQGWIEAGAGIEILGSPSVQMFLRDDAITLYDMTDQILSDESVHEGNLAPPRFVSLEPALGEELLAQAEVAAVWLHEQNYRGTASVDFHLVRRKGEIEVRVCEINARVTGATYPALLARRFHPDGVWLMRNVRFSEPHRAGLILDTLDKACLLYKPEGAGGVLPINLNLTDDRYVTKGQFLALGQDFDEVRNLFDCLLNLEAIIGDYDRD